MKAVLSGAGTLDIGTGGTVDIVRGSDGGQTVDFLAPFATTLETLDLNSARALSRATPAGLPAPT